ncbi:MAG: hypothetical protein K2K52_04585 [Paramuribaculum sp.]|nr:hypothetical protein [Paramuribaculum sp.]
MNLETPQNHTTWYVLNHISPNGKDAATKAVDKYNSINNTTLEIFAPTYIVKEQVNGEIKYRTANLTFHYTFVKGQFEQIKQLCAQPNGFSFLIDRSSSDRYATIDYKTMAAFKNIAKAYKNSLPYYSLENIDLQDGDLVEVIKGDFPGLIGTYMPKPGASSGNIILNIYNNVGTVAFNVKATDVRVLQFSKNTTRANDQIDAFIPHLLKALRLFESDSQLPPQLTAKLLTFCGRMEIAQLTNRKLDARLQILLYAANFVIGNTDQAARHLTKYSKYKDSVTNEWTKALIALIMSVLQSDKQQMIPFATQITAPRNLSKAQQMIADEYRHYLPLAI